MARIIATWFGCGYSPAAPGTAGSLAAIAIAWALVVYTPVTPFHMVLLGIALCVPGVWSAGAVARGMGKDDPSIVVVDEVIGQWVALAGLPSSHWVAWAAAFALFRLFDIWKPPPVRRLEALHGGLGIVADDVMAGLYAAGVLYVAAALGWLE